MAAPAPTSESPQGDSTVVVNRYSINSSIPHRDSNLSELQHVADSLRQLGIIDHITVEGYSSPDGPYPANSELALNRAKRIRSFLTDDLSIPGELISVTSKAEDWDGLRSALADNTSMRSADKAIDIIDNEQNLSRREQRLRNLDYGHAWKYMAREIFPSLRRTVTRFRHRNHEIAVVIRESEETERLPEITDENLPELPDNAVAADENVSETADRTTSNWWIKTNVPAWAMLWINAAVEFDIAPHWSVQLPIYYSGFNYFKQTRKFRTFAVMPEIRWWPRSDNRGFFIGPHFGMAYYNVADDGPYRYQDHDGKTPALGGGISLGVRVPVSRNHRWWLEISAGGGIYKLDYDLFVNEPNGLLAGRRKRTFYGLDNAAISIAYRFDLNKKQDSGKTNLKKGGGL